MGKGVLQGDCSSFSLFNVIIITLIKTIDEEKVRCIGFNFCNSLAPQNWFRFVDDSAFVTSTEQDSQLLLNLFTKWYKWANLIVRVDTCKIFGIRKNGTLWTQFKPCLRVNSKLIPSVKMGDNFIYLGKNFSFDMNNVDVKAELVTDMNKSFGILNRLRYIRSTSYWLFRSISIVNLDGDFLAITLQVPVLYTIYILLLKSAPKDGFFYLRTQILDIFIFQLKTWGWSLLYHLIHTTPAK